MKIKPVKYSLLHFDANLKPASFECLLQRFDIHSSGCISHSLLMKLIVRNVVACDHLELVYLDVGVNENHTNRGLWKPKPYQNIFWP